MLSYGPCGALVHIVNLMIAGFKDVYDFFTSGSFWNWFASGCNGAKMTLACFKDFSITDAIEYISASLLHPLFQFEAAY
jgi:hypothetical protein